ncbi:231_t:CDS:2 [Cetraspora pellucida]|uniref:231_t:CDS:1 n=1 Tax=Cetraspora pellucida TaxID=1433469 RepID=A0A9N9HNS5_9GLOM|nr:231_t:CDS:2 [Cetraspora pellucida]
MTQIKTKQIECFHKIYMLYPMYVIAEDEKTHNKKSDKQDDGAFLEKLQQLVCCIKRCLLNIDL